jgi:hypothetical protein
MDTRSSTSELLAIEERPITSLGSSCMRGPDARRPLRAYGVPAIFGMTRRKSKRFAGPRRDRGGAVFRQRAFSMASRTAFSTVCSVATTGFRSVIQRIRSSV